MLWNWNTIGACFITPQWQIATRGGMVGTCFGVVFLVVALEMLRRATKEFDRWIIRRHNRKQATATAPGARSRQDSPAAAAPADDHTAGQAPASITAGGGVDGADSRKSSSTAAGSDEGGVGGAASGGDAAASVGEEEKKAGQVAPGGDMNNCRAPPCRPNVWQQALRALLHAAQFTVAYIIML